MQHWNSATYSIVQYYNSAILNCTTITIAITTKAMATSLKVQHQIVQH